MLQAGIKLVYASFTPVVLVNYCSLSYFLLIVLSFCARFVFDTEPSDEEKGTCKKVCMKFLLCSGDSSYRHIR
jgi:hypothetical protein